MRYKVAVTSQDILKSIFNHFNMNWSNLCPTAINMFSTVQGLAENSSKFFKSLSVMN